MILSAPVFLTLLVPLLGLGAPVPSDNPHTVHDNGLNQPGPPPQPGRLPSIGQILQSPPPTRQPLQLSPLPAPGHTYNHYPYIAHPHTVHDNGLNQPGPPPQSGRLPSLGQILQSPPPTCQPLKSPLAAPGHTYPQPEHPTHGGLLPPPHSRQTIYLGPKVEPTHEYITDTDNSVDAGIFQIGSFYSLPPDTRYHKIAENCYKVMESDAIIHIPKVHGHSGGFALLPEGTPVRISPYPIVSLPVNRPGSRYINEAEHKTVTDYCNRVFDAEVERRKGGLENRVTHARRCCDKNLPRVGHPDGFLYVEAELRAPRGIGKARGGRLEPHPSPTAKRMLSCENTGICVSP